MLKEVACLEKITTVVANKVNFRKAIATESTVAKESRCQVSAIGLVDIEIAGSENVNFAKGFANYHEPSAVENTDFEYSDCQYLVD